MHPSSLIIAHTVQAGGLLNGVLHPILGLDHLLAMVAVGILSVRLGGKAVWQVPATFVGVMIIGGILGLTGVSLPAVEPAVALSVLAIGVALALDQRLSKVWSILFVGLFALFHGHAHGTEVPELAQPAVYALGFVLSTVALHISGVLVGLQSKKMTYGPEALKTVGAGVACVGLAILIGL